MIQKVASFCTQMMVKSMGVIKTEVDRTKDENVLKVYRKYLGNDYKPGNIYTTVIANHVSWADILILMGRCSPSFVSKASLGNVPFIGNVAKAHLSIFTDRSSKESAGETVENSI